MEILYQGEGELNSWHDADEHRKWIQVPSNAWRSLLLPVALSLVSISYFYAVALPWIPGRDGLAKSIPLTLIAVLGMTLYTLGFDPADPPTYFNRLLGMVAVSVFVAGEMQGMSPQMRGEQANWLWEGAIFTVLLVLFFGVPALMGWR